MGILQGGYEVIFSRANSPQEIKDEMRVFFVKRVSEGLEAAFGKGNDPWRRPEWISCSRGSCEGLNGQATRLLNVQCPFPKFSSPRGLSSTQLSRLDCSHPFPPSITFTYPHCNGLFFLSVIFPSALLDSNHASGPNTMYLLLSYY